MHPAYGTITLMAVYGVTAAVLVTWREEPYNTAAAALFGAATGLLPVVSWNLYSYRATTIENPII